MTGHEDAALKAATDVLFEEVNPPGVRQQHSHRVVTDMARRMLAAARPHLEAAAAAAERERCAQVAEEVDAFYDAPCPDGAPGCVHQDTPFADLLRNPPEGDPHA